MKDKLIEKQCSKCRKIKLYSQFNRDRTKKDGYKTFCTLCSRKVNKLYTQSNAKKESRKRWEQNNKLKLKAKRIIKKLLKEGKLKKENCYFCDCPITKTHNLLYEFPLKIIWVCEEHRVRLLPNHYLMSVKRQTTQNDLIIELKNKIRNL